MLPCGGHAELLSLSSQADMRTKRYEICSTYPSDWPTFGQKNSITMPFCTGRPCLWPLILSLCLTSVTSLNFIQDSPKTWWVDGSCIQKRFTPITARETFQIATLGARRLLNLNDQNQGWVFNLLFKSERDFSILAEGDTEAWNVVGKKLPALPFEMH